MRRSHPSRGVVSAAVTFTTALLACTTPQSATEDERGNVGVEGTPSDYCTSNGYQFKDGRCIFPDQSACEAWSFFRGECGQAFSYCNRHGGTVRNEVRNEGTWTSSLAVCTLKNGTTCAEVDFARTGVCQ